MIEQLIKENSAQPLLTLAIPTFNRLECLRLLVDSVINQIPNEGVLGESFELLICNNASSDGTTEYLNELANAKVIRVIHHASNCGPVDNIIHCFESATGKFVWVMGDDDVPLCGAINAVMENIEQENPALMYLPSKWVAGDLGKMANHPISSTNVRSISNISLAVRSSVYITFISSWVINKELYLSQKNTKFDRYRDTSLPQLEWFFSLIGNERIFLYAEDNWVVARAGNSGGYSILDTFSQQYNQIVNDKFKNSPKLNCFYRSDMLWSFMPSMILGLRKNTIGDFGSFDRDKVLKLLKTVYGKDLFFVWVLVPIITQNIIFARIYALIARILAKLRAMIWRAYCIL